METCYIYSDGPIGLGDACVHPLDILLGDVQRYHLLGSPIILEIITGRVG